MVSGGPGVNTFGLRSLDPGRTLLLVNGRRFTPAGTRGQVSKRRFEFYSGCLR